MKQTMTNKPRTWKKYIEMENKKIKRKGYPAKSWIESATKISNFEKNHKVTLFSGLSLFWFCIVFLPVPELSLNQ